MAGTDVQSRFRDRARNWGVAIERTLETASSLVAFGTRAGDQTVVLKVIKQAREEWRSGAILDAFDGHGIVRVYEYVDGALLLERLSPGDPLVSMALNGGDDEATAILGDVIQRMSGRKPPNGCPTVQNWGEGFQRHVAAGGSQIPGHLVDEASRLYSALGASQRSRHLLHGDLQHYNVLYDSSRGWLGIDPKGVVGELEYEVGALLRNPTENPDLFASPVIVERRLDQLARRLDLDRSRALSWAFAQAVLSAIWSVEDGYVVDASNPSLRLAQAIRPMLPSDL